MYKIFLFERKSYKEICVLNNVDFIVIKIGENNNVNITNKKNDIINLLVERDLSMAINLDSELLWKLTFIKLDDTITSKYDNKYSFDALFTIHHEVTYL
jgi:hypothetical protein